MSKLSRVGFEIEGGWDGKAGISPFPDIALITDHSINGQTLKSDIPINPPHVGEAVSAPFPYLPAESQPEWVNWLTSHWPNAEPPHRTNRTCGFHIHISLVDHLSYAQLTSKSFLLTLRDSMLEAGKERGVPKKHIFWERMHGANTFCDLFFDAGVQMGIKEKGINRSRYGWLNFSYGLHGTVEFRALPTFRDASLAVYFADKYFKLVDSWLAAQGEEVLSRTKTFKG